MAPPLPGGSQSKHGGGGGGDDGDRCSTPLPIGGGERQQQNPQEQPLVNEASPLRATAITSYNDEGERKRGASHDALAASAAVLPSGSKASSSSSSLSHHYSAEDLDADVPIRVPHRVLISESGVNRSDYEEIEAATYSSGSRGDSVPIPRYPPAFNLRGIDQGPSLSIASSREMSWAKQMTMLMLVSILPFGGHFVKNCLTSLEVYLIDDPRLHLTEMRYGLLLSMTSLPNFFIPFLGGIFLDKRGHRFATLMFLFLILMGQIIFTMAIQLGNFKFALVGRFVLGLGEGSVVVAQRAVISHVFKAKSQITFAVGVSVAMACVAKTLSRATVVPASNVLGTYIGGLWYSVVVCLFSTLAGIIFLVLSDEKEDPFTRKRNKSVSYADSFLMEPPPHGTLSHTPTYHSMIELRSNVANLSFSFWALCILHTIYINVFHIFLNFSSHYFSKCFGKDPQTSAYITSSASVLVIFLGPLVGYLIDHLGGQLYVCSFSSIIVVIAYYLLSYSTFDPLYDVILMSIGESFIPIVVMALIPFTVGPKVYGAAFGIVEVTGAVSSFGGNVFIGYLLDRDDGQYGQAMLALTLLATFGMLVLLTLTIYDACCGYKGLNTKHELDYEVLASIDE